MELNKVIQGISKLAPSSAQRVVAPRPVAHLKRETVGLWFAGTVATVALVATSPSAEAADLALGAEVFNNNCAACHTGGYNSVQVEKTLRKADIEKYLDGGFNVAAIENQVTNGKNAMPAWGDRLSEDEIQAVAAYVFDQASGDKW